MSAAGAVLPRLEVSMISAFGHWQEQLNVGEKEFIISILYLAQFDKTYLEADALWNPLWISWIQWINFCKNKGCSRITSMHLSVYLTNTKNLNVTWRFIGKMQLELGLRALRQKHQGTLNRWWQAVSEEEQEVLAGDLMKTPGRKVGGTWRDQAPEIIREANKRGGS